jgi:hypothetical protein
VSAKIAESARLSITPIAARLHQVDPRGARGGEDRDSVWILSIEDKKIMPYGGVESAEPIGSVFSPDGRWIAYSSSPPVGGAGPESSGVPSSQQMRIVLNWFEELKTRVPTR